MFFELEMPNSISGQIASKLRSRILSGEFHCGEQFPTVRSLAVELAVNPNTVQKALSILEDEGLLISKTTVGRFITNDEKILIELKEEYKKTFMETAVKTAFQMGIDKNTFTDFIEQSEVLK